MTEISSPAGGMPGYLRRARSDSLVRNSFYLMASTIVTGCLGYVFWALAAHIFARAQVGLASAVISLCTTAALLTYLGSSAILIERLPQAERSSHWTRVLLRICLATAGVTALAAVAAVFVLIRFAEYHLFFRTAAPTIVAVLGAATWTLVNLIGAAFIAARRAGRLLAIQGLISVAKVLLLLPVAALGVGATRIVEAWVASALLGLVFGVGWLLPRMGLGRRPGRSPRRSPSRAPHSRGSQYRNPRHRQPYAPPRADSVRHLMGQHLTSVGGAVTPLVLPILVILRLGATENAYFYITWMLGLSFFMVSPSVATAVFAEGVRANSNLRAVVRKALRVIAALLAPAILVMIIGGRLVLGLFGHAYATAGYELLVLLAVSSIPDAVSNVAVAVFRVTDRLGYSTTLNLGIFVGTLTASWILMPRLGIAGVGAAWLGMQVLGAVASFPAFASMQKRSATLTRVQPTGLEPAADPGRGIELLMDLAELQSLDRLSGRLP